MERKKRLQMRLTDLEFDLLDACYFMTSYNEIFAELNCSKEEFRSCLLGLLKNELLQQLIYREDIQDFDKLDQFDESLLEEAKYVITKKGLQQHNGKEI